MRFTVSVLFLTTALIACQTVASVKSAYMPAVLDNTKAKAEITPSKIYGNWKLESLEGLEQAFKAEEKAFADRGETILWNTTDAQRGLELSYDFNALTNETNVTLRSSNVQEDYYSGLVQTSLKDITYKDTIPPTLLYLTSNVMDASGEIEPRGRAPVEVAPEVMKSNQPNFATFRLEDDNQTLIFEDVLGTELARFRRLEAAATEPQLHALSRAEAPYWSVVSLKGLDEAMRDFYDSGVAIPGMANSEQVEQFKKVDFDVFKKVNGDLRIYAGNDQIITSYQTCNGAVAEYELKQGEWSYLTQKQTMVACDRRIPVGDGTFVVGAGNQNLSENVFLKNAPDVTGYAVSEDGQMLTLLGAPDETLGVFSYKGMTR